MGATRFCTFSEIISAILSARGLPGYGGSGCPAAVPATPTSDSWSSSDLRGCSYPTAAIISATSPSARWVTEFNPPPILPYSWSSTASTIYSTYSSSRLPAILKALVRSATGPGMTALNDGMGAMSKMSYGIFTPLFIASLNRLALTSGL